MQPTDRARSAARALMDAANDAAKIPPDEFGFADRQMICDALHIAGASLPVDQSATYTPRKASN